MDKNSMNTEFYREYGATIEIGDYLVLGIHPDNLDNNLEALISGDLVINYKEAFDNYLNLTNQIRPMRLKLSLVITVKGRVVINTTYSILEHFQEFIANLDNGIVTVNWTEAKRISEENYNPIQFRHLEGITDIKQKIAISKMATKE